MNNPFDTLTSNELEQSTDSLGGGGPLPTNVYPGIISMVYAGESSGGAKSLTVHVALDNGREYRETLYVTSSKEKGQKNYYERDGKKHPLPGYTVANDLALLSTGKDLSNQTWEEKVVKVYDYNAKAEVPTKVLVATSMLNLPIKLAIQQETRNKRAKNAQGVYEETNDSVDVNSIDKVFHHKSGQTSNELMASKDQNAPGEFIEKWQAKNADKTRNRFKSVSGASGSGSPLPQGNTSAPSLFG